MLAAAVVAIVFTGIFIVTRLAARAEEAEARCDEHLARIRQQLDAPAVSTVAPQRRPRPPAPS